MGVGKGGGGRERRWGKRGQGVGKEGTGVGSEPQASINLDSRV